MNLRALAAIIIEKVFSGKSLSPLLDEASSNLSDPRDQALLKALCYGVCRLYPRLDFVLGHLLHKPLPKKDNLLRALLWVGIYQLMTMRIPEHAAVNETVDAAKMLKKPYAKRLINALLRHYLRASAEINHAIKQDLPAYYAHSTWWIEQIKMNWPMHWQSILNANNEQAPLCIRVNRQCLSAPDYVQLLSNAGISARQIPETEAGICLFEAVSIEGLPGFAEGYFSVQDGAAQLAAPLLKLAPQLRVLDACAAPGGKLTHIVELETQLAELVAIEKDPTRMNPIKENLKRLNMYATCICEDASKPLQWWDGQLFDRILLDAPCSGSGVIRRHPDIKWLRKPKDIKSLVAIQSALLEALWPLLAVGGYLLYVTCSILSAENNEMITSFLQRHGNAQADFPDVAWGVACQVGRQILPGGDYDGFYFARIKKCR